MALIPMPGQAQLLERWPGRWVMLAAQDVKADAGPVQTDLSRVQTAFKALRIHNKGPALEIDRIVVTYADRTQYESKKAVRIAAGSRSWPIDFRRSHKFVDAVTLTLRPQDWQGRIEIWGLQDSHGAAARRPPPAKPVATTGDGRQRRGPAGRRARACGISGNARGEPTPGERRCQGGGTAAGLADRARLFRH
jgi:hypothetical protein